MGKLWEVKVKVKVVVDPSNEKIMKGIYWSVELTSKVRGSRRYNEGIIILNNGRPVVVEYEVEVEEEEISSTTTTTTTKKVIEKTKCIIQN